MRIGLLAAAFVLPGLQACSLQQFERIDTNALRQQTTSAVRQPLALAPMSLATRMAFPEFDSVVPAATEEPLYTFQVNDTDIKQALRLFARAYGLNILIADDVSAMVSVDFRDLPFDEAMQALLNMHGFYWVREGQLIHVKSEETRIFEIDYIRLVRAGSGSSQAQVSSTSSSSSDSGGTNSGDTAGTMSIQQTDSVSFWEELEEQLAGLVSDSGRLVVNRLAGTIQITDQHRRVEEIAGFIEKIEQSIYRQVDIEIKIVEVSLNDDLSLGIDWSRLVSSSSIGDNIDYLIDNAITSGPSGAAALPASLVFTYSNIGADGRNDLTGILSALSQQGEVQVVSQPHIRTLNNKSALIKVGTDRTFFRKEQITDSTNAGSQTFSSDVPQVVTEGIVLAITPQISVDGWITMDVSPVVTRVSSVSEAVDGNGVVQSTAPNLDISQTSSLVRAQTGQTIIMGGLIQMQDGYISRGVPGLKRIPGLGRLFDGIYRAEQKKELIIMVTPRLIGSDGF